MDDLMSLCEKRKESNLKFFSHDYPEIYQQLLSVSLRSIELQVDVAHNNLDLLRDGKSLYGGSAEAFAQKEFCAYRDELLTNVYHGWLSPCVSGVFTDYPRMFHRTREKIYAASSLRDRQSWKGYRVVYPLPLLVVMGVGLGYHIEQSIRDSFAKSIIVYEPDLESFLASCYSVDWKQMLDQAEEKGITLSFIMGNEDAEVLTLRLWKALKLYYPTFPILTHFYNHCSQENYHKTVERMKQEFMVYFFGRGNYDDEISQLNQAMYNLRHLEVTLVEQNKYPVEMPVIIVGAGPSLDDRIEDLKRMSPYAVVISAGSALTALYQYDIKPDLHVELESDFLGTEIVSTIDDEEYLNDIPLLGPLQLSPAFIEAFKGFYAFFRGEGELRSLLSSDAGIEISGLPNCVNQGLVIALLFGFRRCYLFGTDLGYRDEAHHHSRTSFYYNDQIHDFLKGSVDIARKDTIPVEGVDGEPVQTELFYLKAKLGLEKLISGVPDQFDFYNCSDGAKISGTQWIERAHFNTHFTQYVQVENIDTDQLGENKKRLIAAILDRTRLKIDVDQLSSRISQVVDNLSEIVAQIDAILKHRRDGVDQFLNQISEIQRLLDSDDGTCDPVVRSLVLESFCLLCCDGLEHLLSIGEEEWNRFSEHWGKTVTEFFKAIPKHVDTVLNNAMSGAGNEMAFRSVLEPDRDSD